MSPDSIQASSPAATAEQVGSGVQPKGTSALTGAPAPAKSQPDADYAELSQAQPPSAQAQAQPPPSQYVLAYHIDEQTNQLYFQVLNPQSGQVISQVPPQDVLNDEEWITQYLQTKSASSSTPVAKAKGD
jgi:hypothetical protein